MQSHIRFVAFGRIRCAIGGIATALIALAVAPAGASQLIVPFVSLPDAALGGATVANPRTPAGAAFSDPAALTRFEDRQMSASAAMPIMHSSVDADFPDGYDSRRFGTGFGPEFGLALDGPGGWHFGVASYGNVGLAFKSDAAPELGVTGDFYSELSVANVSFVAARNITDRLSIGASVAALVGWTRLRYTAGIPFYYTLGGPGVQAMLGARYQATDRVAFGIGVRPPGRVWADGDMDMPDGGSQDVDLELRMPSQIFVGTSMDVTRRVSVHVYGRWTDTSSFGKSLFRFEQTPQADAPVVPDANDEWRIGGGLECLITERVTLSFGVGFADSIVGDHGVSPLLIDSQEVMATAGFSYAFDRFTVDALFGNDFSSERNIDASEAMVFPGQYRISGHVVGIGIRMKL